MRHTGLPTKRCIITGYATGKDATSTRQHLLQRNHIRGRSQWFLWTNIEEKTQHVLTKISCVHGGLGCEASNKCSNTKYSLRVTHMILPYGIGKGNIILGSAEKCFLLLFFFSTREKKRIDSRGSMSYFKLITQTDSPMSKSSLGSCMSIRSMHLSCSRWMMQCSDSDATWNEITQKHHIRKNYGFKRTESIFKTNSIYWCCTS